MRFNGIMTKPTSKEKIISRTMTSVKCEVYKVLMVWKISVERQCDTDVQPISTATTFKKSSSWKKVCANCKVLVSHDKEWGINVKIICNLNLKSLSFLLQLNILYTRMYTYKSLYCIYICLNFVSRILFFLRSAPRDIEILIRNTTFKRCPNSCSSLSGMLWVGHKSPSKNSYVKTHIRGTIICKVFFFSLFDHRFIEMLNVCKYYDNKIHIANNWWISKYDKAAKQKWKYCCWLKHSEEIHLVGNSLYKVQCTCILCKFNAFKADWNQQLNEPKKDWGWGSGGWVMVKTK